jgi:hypothetical protein
MKSTLEFNLPDDSYYFNCAVNSAKAFGVLDDVYNQIRSVRKYDVDPQKALDNIESLMTDILALKDDWV